MRCKVGGSPRKNNFDTNRRCGVMQKEQDEPGQEGEEQPQETEAETAQTALQRAHTLAERVAAYRKALQSDPRIARLHLPDMTRPLEVPDSYMPLRLHQDPRPGYDLEWVVQSNDPHPLRMAHPPPLTSRPHIPLPPKHQ